MLSPHEQLLIPVDVESIIVTYLRDELPLYTGNTVSISTKMPKNSDVDVSVWLFSSGGTQVDRFSTVSNVTVNALGDDEDTVVDVLRLVSGLIRLAPLNVADITNVDAGSILPAGEDDGTPRYFFASTVFSRHTPIERK